MKNFYLFLSAVFLLLFSNFISPQEMNKDNSGGIKPALLVIDIQKAFLPLMDKSDTDDAMYMINAYIDYFHKKGCPVIRIYHSDPQWGPAPGTDTFEFPSTVRISQDDPKVVKHHASGFKQTDLEKILMEKGCNTLFLCGLSATGCVLATYMEANDLEFDAFLLKHATMSHKAAYTSQVENIFGAVDDRVVEVMLKNVKKQ